MLLLRVELEDTEPERPREQPVSSDDRRLVVAVDDVPEELLLLVPDELPPIFPPDLLLPIFPPPDLLEVLLPIFPLERELPPILPPELRESSLLLGAESSGHSIGAGVGSSLTVVGNDEGAGVGSSRTVVGVDEGAGVGSTRITVGAGVGRCLATHFVFLRFALEYFGQRMHTTVPLSAAILFPLHGLQGFPFLLKVPFRQLLHLFELFLP